MIDEVLEARAQPVPARSRPSPARAAAAARLAAGSATAAASALAEKLHPTPAPAAPPGEEPGRPRHLSVVEAPALSPAQRRRRARAILFGAVALGTVIALALVYFHVVLAQRQFRLDHMNAMVQKDQQTYENLRLQVAQLGSPAHIISTAEGRLGMVQPTKVVYLTPTTVAGAPTAKAPATGGSQAAKAPAGDADWPMIKSQLAGTP